MKTPVATLAAEAGVIAGGALGNSIDHQRSTPYDGGSQHVQRELFAQWPQPPPPPTPDALWIPGNWTFNGRAKTWTAGHWEIPPPNAFAHLAA